MADGEIRLDIRAKADKLGGDLAKSSKELDRLTKTFDRQVNSIRKQEIALADMRRQLDAMTAGEKQIASIKNMETQLKNITAEIKAQESAQAELVKEYEYTLSTIQKMTKAGMPQADVEKQLASLNKFDEQLIKSGDSLDFLNNKASELSEKIAEVKLDPATSAEALKLSDSISFATDKLERTKEEARQTDAQIKELLGNRDKTTESNVGGIGTAAKGVLGHILKALGAIKLFGRDSKKSTSQASSGFERLTKRIWRMVAAAFVFNVIRRGLRELTDYLGAAMKTNQQFVNSLASIKGNLLTAFQPIYEAIMPALNALMSALARVTAYIAAFVNLLFGKSVKASQDSAEALHDQANAVGALGKAAKGALAPFDELMVLSQESAAGGAGAGEDVAAPTFDYDFSMLEDYFKQFETIPDAFYDLGKRIAEAIARGLANIDWTDVKEKARVIAASIAEFINGFIDTPEFWFQIGRTVGEGLSTAAEFAEEFADRLKWHELGEMIAYGLNTAIETWDPELAGRAIYKNLNGIMDTIYTFLTQTNWGVLGAKFSAGLNTIFAGANWDLLGRTVAAKFNATLDFLSNSIKAFKWDDAGKNLGSAINGFVAEIKWNEIGETISNLFKGALSFIIEGIKEADWEQVGTSLGEWIMSIDIKGIANNLVEAINEAIIAAFQLAGGIYGVVYKGLFESLVPDVTLDEEIKKAGGNVFLGFYEGLKAQGEANREKVKRIWQNIVDRFKEVFKISSPSKVMMELGIFIVQGLADGITSLLQSVIDLFTQIWEGVQAIWEPVAIWFDETVIQPVSEFFSILWELVPQLAGNAWDAIKGVWESVSGWFDDHIISPLTNAFKSFVNTVLSFFGNMGNGIIEIFERAINWIIDALNRIRFDIPSWVPGIGGRSFGINIPNVSLGRIQIPQLATGGIVDQATIAMIGERGREAVVPLDRNTGWMDEMAERIALEISNLDLQSNVTIQFTGTLSSLAQVLNPVIIREQRRVGSNLVTGTV